MIVCVSLDELLRRQEGVVSRPQLLGSGVPYSLVRSHCRSGLWQRLQHGVYATFSGDPGRTALIWAAVLRCSPDAVASHDTAAELLGLADGNERTVHVPVDSRRRIRGNLDRIHVHYSHRLVDVRHPVQTPPRTRLDETVLDLVATSQSARRAAHWVLTAVQRRLTTADRLAAALTDRKKIRWRRLIEAMLCDVATGAQSMLEVEHLRRVERAHGLPVGRRQRRDTSGGTIWIDVDHDEFATRIELDGRLGHVGDGAFRDRRRDNAGVIARMWTLRYGYAEVFGDACGVAAEQAAAFADRGWSGEPRRCGPSCSLPAALVEIYRRRAA